MRKLSCRGYIQVLLTILALQFPSHLAANTRSSSFNDVDSAVKAAADIYNPISIREDREYMGVIYKVGTNYYFSVYAAQPGSDSFRFSLPLDSWDMVVALWHTHGARKVHHQYFSDTDTSMVNRYGKPFYLADHTGVLKVYEKGGSTMRKYAALKLGLPAKRGYARGKKVRDPMNRLVRIKTIQSLP